LKANSIPNTFGIRLQSVAINANVKLRITKFVKKIKHTVKWEIQSSEGLH